MNPILKFIRATLTGGILFLLPIVLLIILFNKAREIFHVLSTPLGPPARPYPGVGW